MPCRGRAGLRGQGDLQLVSAFPDDFKVLVFRQPRHFRPAAARESQRNLHRHKAIPLVFVTHEHRRLQSDAHDRCRRHSRNRRLPLVRHAFDLKPLAGTRRQALIKDRIHRRQSRCIAKPEGQRTDSRPAQHLLPVLHPRCLRRGDKRDEPHAIRTHSLDDGRAGRHPRAVRHRQRLDAPVLCRLD